MNLKKQRGIVYNKIKSVQADDLMIYQPVPAPVDKIKNKYRWQMIVKGKVNSSILDILKYATQDEMLSKMKNTSILLDINPNTLM